MYCGDETGSFIGDIGSSSSRFGYGGEDSPKYVIPSLVVASDGDQIRRVVPSTLHSSCRASSPPRYSTALNVPSMVHYDQPLTDANEYLCQGDSWNDWDAVETLWQTALDAMHVKHIKHYSTTTTTTASTGLTSTRLVATPTCDNVCIHPILAVSPGFTSTAHKKRAQLSKFAELAFECLETKALFVAPSPMLAAFCYGRSTALVVDIGAGGCRVTPVVDGLLLTQSQRRNGRGSDWLSNIVWKALQPNKLIRPRCPTTATGLHYRWAMHDLMYEFRTSGHVYLPQWWYDPTVPFVYTEPEDTTADAVVASTTTPAVYELPDGTLVDLTNRLGKDLCRVPELWFTDHVPFNDTTTTTTTTSLQDATCTNLPLHRLVHESLSSVTDVDVRKELASSILLTGGPSVVPNLEQRLSLEVPRLVSSAFGKTKVVASRYHVERQFAGWIGASILSSLGSFQQLWLSKTEYEEYGATLAVQRFP